MAFVKLKGGFDELLSHDRDYEVVEIELCLRPLHSTNLRKARYVRYCRYKEKNGRGKVWPSLTILSYNRKTWRTRQTPLSFCPNLAVEDKDAALSATSS